MIENLSTLSNFFFFSWIFFILFHCYFPFYFILFLSKILCIEKIHASILSSFTVCYVLIFSFDHVQSKKYESLSPVTYFKKNLSCSCKCVHIVIHTTVSLINEKKGKISLHFYGSQKRPIHKVCTSLKKYFFQWTNSQFKKWKLFKNIFLLILIFIVNSKFRKI